MSKQIVVSNGSELGNAFASGSPDFGKLLQDWHSNNNKQSSVHKSRVRISDRIQYNITEKGRRFVAGDLVPEYG